MLHRIGGEVDGADVVALEGGALKGAVKLVEELAHPGDLRHIVGLSAVLGLCAGAGDDRLSLGGLGDEVGAQKHGMSGSGSASVGATDPVSVVVDHELRCRGWSE
jgi:hypothetical protein